MSKPVLGIILGAVLGIADGLARNLARPHAEILDLSGEKESANDGGAAKAAQREAKPNQQSSQMSPR